jgi:uncharacterized protein with von Willebrand factor type A (vWA) domain
MRSDLVFEAAAHVSNRYQLAKVLSLATRALHRPGTRIQDTMNGALVQLSQARPTVHSQPSREASSAADHSENPHSSMTTPKVLDMERKAGVEPIQFFQCAAAPGVDQFPVSLGVLFTATSPMQQAQNAK